MKQFSLPSGAICCLALSLLVVGCKKQQVTESTSPDTVQGEQVLTPFGYLPKDNVVQVENGFSLLIDKGHVFKLKKSTGERLADLGTISRTAPRLSRIQSFAGSRAQQPALSGSPAPSNPNWITSAFWVNNTGAPINHFQTNWVVPSNPPAANGQTDYIFNGLENNTGSDILQPVLQYGPSNAGGGGANWYIANWYVWTDAGGHTRGAHSALIPVAVGMPLTGVMDLNGNLPDGSFNYTSSFNGYANALNVIEGNANSTGLPFPFIPEQSGAYETFEAYTSSNGIPPVQDYPGGTFVAMTGIRITNIFGDVPLAWTPNYQTYGYKTVVVSNASPNGEVHMYFRPPAGPTPVITSLGERPAGGAIGSIIIYFTEGLTEYYNTPPNSYYVKIVNNRLASYVISQQYSSGSPLFANPPAGTLRGDNLTVYILAVFFDNTTSNYSAGLSMTY